MAVRRPHPSVAVRRGFGAHDPDRRRKLLLHRGQIDELLGRTQQQPLTLIPVRLYFQDGKAKVELALARGRRLHDKRRLLAAKEAEREMARMTRRATQWIEPGGSLEQLFGCPIGAAAEVAVEHGSEQRLGRIGPSEEGHRGT